MPQLVFSVSAPTSLLLKLPLELLLNITNHLTTPELGNMRLSCRQVQALLFPSFAQEFFERKQFMLTIFSLQALVDISKSRLGRHVHSLHIALETVRSPGLNRPGVRTRRITSGQAHRQIQSYTEQWIFRSTGRDLDMLAEALRNLGSLKDIVIRDSNSHGRIRDGPTASWNSYGSQTFLDQTNSLTATHHLPESSVWEVFLTVLRAIAAAKADIKGIELVLRKHEMPWTGSLYIPEYLRHILTPVLRNLEKLHLCSGDASRRDEATSSFGRILSTLGVCDLITHTSNLRELSFKGPTRGGRPLTETAFLNWLALPIGDEERLVTCRKGPGEEWNAEEEQILRSSPCAVALPHLTTLSVGRLALAADLLENLIVKFSSTVRHLELWRVSLYVGPHDEPASSWTKLLVNLINHEPPLNFHSLRFGKLYYLRDAALPNEPGGIENILIGDPIEYTGMGWKGFLAETMERMHKAQEGKSLPFNTEKELPCSMFYILPLHYLFDVCRFDFG